MKKLHCWLHALCTMGVAVLAGCHTIYDGDCTPSFRLSFRYDWNVKFADAFANEVKSLSVYFFDEDGTLVRKFGDAGDRLAGAGYTLPVELPAGTYQVVTWAGLAGHGHFSVPDLQPGVSTLDELRCRIRRETDADGTACVREDLNDPNALFHACQRMTLPDDPGTHTVPVSLVKNTNVVRVVLQSLAGDVEADDYTFRIEDANGGMAYDNTLLPDDSLVYSPWRTRTGTVDVSTDGGTRSLKIAVAELTVGRLVTDHRPRLTVTAKEGKTVLSIPLIDYVLLVKGNYRQGMSDQEYLDRQDEYSLTFLLDENNRWDRVHIHVNGWALVLNEESVGKEGGDL